MNTTSRTTLQALGSGLAGAAAAAIANETAKRVITNSPHHDFLGKRLVSGKGLYRAGIAGNLISNSLLYGLFGVRRAKHNWLRGALLGLGAGLGAMAIPQQKRGFWFKPARRTKRTKLGTIGRYLAGGLAAAAASRLISKATHKRHSHNLFD